MVQPDSSHSTVGQNAQFSYHNINEKKSIYSDDAEYATMHKGAFIYLSRIAHYENKSSKAMFITIKGEGFINKVIAKKYSKRKHDTVHD